jgi:hypothetical protein
VVKKKQEGTKVRKQKFRERSLRPAANEHFAEVLNGASNFLNVKQSEEVKFEQEKSDSEEKTQKQATPTCAKSSDANWGPEDRDSRHGGAAGRLGITGRACYLLSRAQDQHVPKSLYWLIPDRKF